MLVQLVSALGLLAVSTVVVDIIMVYVMPNRVQYAEEKFQVTKDYHPEHSSQDSPPAVDLNKSLVRERLLTPRT